MSRPEERPAATPRGGLAAAGATAWRILGIGALVVATWWLSRQLMGILVALVVAVLIATLLRPLAAALERRRLPRSAAAMLSVVGLVAVVVAAMALIIPPFVERIGEVGANVEEGLRQVANSLADDIAGVSRQEVNQTIDDAISGLSANRGAIAGELLAGATAVVQAAAGVVLVLFVSFFCVRDGDRMWEWIVSLFPDERRDGMREIGAEAYGVLGTYVRGVVFVATVDATLIGLALVIVGVPLVMPLVVLTWIAAFFPIVGAVVAGFIAVLVTLVAVGPVAALVILGAIVVVQQLEGNVLYPMVVGPRLRLHPVVVLLAVTLGGSVGGIAGAFLAVPVATVAAVVIEHARGGNGRGAEVPLPASVERAHREEPVSSSTS